MSQTQTEGTNLAVTEETVLGASTPPTIGWRNLDPNSYGNFGSSFKKTPRDPISKSQQLRKGMLTDEDSGLPFEADVTKDMIDRFGEGVFRCRTKHCGNKQQSIYDVSGVTATGFTVASNGDVAQHFLILPRGFSTPANNGLKEVGAASTGTETKTAGLVVEAAPPPNATFEIAGYRGQAGDIQLDANGDLTSTLVDFTTWNIQPYQFLFVGGEAAANKFATAEYFGAVRAKTITAHKITLDRRTWEVTKKAFLALATVAIQLNTIVQAKVAGVAGNSTTVASVADGTPAAKAELALNSVGTSTHINTVVRAKLAGTAGNSITVEVTTGAPTAAGQIFEVGQNVKIKIKTTATATTVADVETLIATSTLIEVKTPGTPGTSLDGTDAFSSTALAGGTNATAPTVSEVGAAVTLHYTSGFTTVAQLEAAIAATSTLIEVKTAGTPGNVLLVGDDDFAATNLAHGAEGTDNGAGKQIDVYFSRWLRNVAIDHADYKLPSYAFEMTYPTLSGGAPMYEYMLGNMVDEWVWNIPLTGKATVNATFTGTRTLKLTAARKTGPSAAKNPNASGGISTATDLLRLRIAGVDELGISSDFQMLKVTVKNNVSPQKQLGKLGARLMNQGKHTETVEADCIFVTPDAIDAVRDNRDATLDILMRNGDFGALLDIQAMTLDSSDRKLEKDKSVIISSKTTGHQHDLTGSTASLSVFAFLPAPDLDAD